LYASLLFGATAALAPALQSVGVSSGYYLYNAAPYVLTLVILIITTSKNRFIPGMPGVLSGIR
jgi:simple sugar transport system permease protein